MPLQQYLQHLENFHSDIGDTVNIRPDARLTMSNQHLGALGCIILMPTAQGLSGSSGC